MMEQIWVETYSGYKADQEPRAFHVEGKRIEVEEVLGCRRIYDVEDGRVYVRYKVMAEDGRIYEISLDEREGIWYLIRSRRSDER